MEVPVVRRVLGLDTGRSVAPKEENRRKHHYCQTIARFPADGIDIEVTVFVAVYADLGLIFLSEPVRL